ncbi:hypothetical protein B0T16DRAFT_457921 [Cercophora newfieldiana]|uniref:Nonsense-mediated mRNA decay factor n=1 Tax=Cercophora newfieldiana TaxID=92897 RepID=A0AA40CNZ4_9PEZI|nr:hypothetical protein B0T16DRAFT_457921 [Cercophora newfieldiana]
MAARAPKKATAAPNSASGAATTAPAADVADAAATKSMDPQEMIAQNWNYATKSRSAIEKELGKVQTAGLDGDVAMSGFNKVEELLKNYRLYCLEIIMLDIRTAAAEDMKVESCLWQTHVNVTKAYRNVINRQQGPNLAVLKRKLEKQYIGFLTTSLSYYRAYLQRFCGRYKSKELERVARRVKFDDLSAPAVAPIANTDPEVLKLVNYSFHMTLICLGDLSRYRALVRSKDRSFDAALTYYSLANEMMPDAGHGYHQSAVIYAEAKNHLEIVYNMYRAMACDRPHPLAKQNLEREFRDILHPSGGGGAKGSLETMVKWFVKLHAYYYKGEAFAGRKELEHEVDHRLSMALKTGGEAGVDNTLLKMVLINITAYVAGLATIKTEYSLAKSQTCQFVLQLNTRTIYTISSLLLEELKDIVQQKPLQAIDAAVPGGEGSSKFTPAFCRIMPLFRVYMTWLLFYKSDLNEYRSHLEPQFGNMCKSLAHTLTLLLELLGQISSSATAWLFPEDEETIGMKCLNGPDLYDGCQLRVDGLDKTLKPSADEVPSATRTVEHAASFRAFDAVLCGLRLAADPWFPITGPDGLNVFSYVESTKWPAAAPNPPAIEPQVPVHASSFAAAVTAPAARTISISKGQAPAQPVETIPAITDSEDFSDDGEFYQPAAQRVQSADRQPVAAPDVALVATGSEFPIDAQLSRILNDFLAPPERSSGQARVDHEETSYGMGSRTADDMFGNATAAASTSPAPGSANSKTFPSLPWNYFVPTAPADHNLQNTGTMRSPSNGWDSRPASSGSPRDVHYSTKLNDLFAASRNSARRSGSYATSPYAYQGPQDWADQTALANKAVREQTALQAQSAFSVANTGLPSHSREPSSLTSPSALWQQNTAQNPASSSHQPNHSSFSYSSANFSAFDSSLPPVNSPFGVPMAQAQAYGYQGLPSSGMAYSQQLTGFPNIQQPTHTSPYSPGIPPGFSAPQGVPGNGTGYELTSAARGNSSQGFPIRSYGPESYDGQVDINAWSNNYGPRSADDADLRTGGNSRIVPTTSTLAQPTGRVVSTGWNAKPKPK